MQIYILDERRMHISKTLVVASLRGALIIGMGFTIVVESENKYKDYTLPF